MFQVTVGHSLEMTMEQMTMTKSNSNKNVQIYQFSNKSETYINIASYYKT